MKKLEFTSRDLLMAGILMVLVLLISFGFGYFIGRSEQIELNKKALKRLPDLNQCFKNQKAKLI